jgi:hypothetical protein
MYKSFVFVYLCVCARLESHSIQRLVSNDRFKVMYGFGVDMLDQGKLVAIAHSVKDDQRQTLAQEFGFYEPQLKTHVRMDCILSGYVRERASRLVCEAWLVVLPCANTILRSTGGE